MNENLRSMVTGTAALYIIAILALILTFTRRVKDPEPGFLKRFVSLFLLAIACHCFHLLEEMITGFHERWPAFLGLAPWSIEFFVGLNVSFVALWTVAVVGILRQIQAAYFLVWFLILAGIVNIIAHPLLSLAHGGYFPGLLTAPFLGILGFKLASMLWKMTGKSIQE